MKYLYDTFTTPIGKYTIVTDEAGAIVATAFGDLAGMKNFPPTSKPVRDGPS